MKISVLIIAHNEEKHIHTCLESISHQTITPDEIVVIAHNCTDNTVSIAQSFKNVRVVEYAGPEGVPYSRVKGFEEVTGDIVACLDGDSAVTTTWLKNITDPLIKNKKLSIVAGYVVLSNTLVSKIISFWQFIVIRKLLRVRLHYFAWGSNFACRKSDYEHVGGIKPLITLRGKLNLHFWAEDVYISFALMQIGNIYFALNAKSYTQIPQWKLDIRTAPIKQWNSDNLMLLHYFTNKK